MRCPACGTQAAAGAGRCPICGRPLPVGREAEPGRAAPDRLVGETFVGRERELAVLHAGLDDALGGRGRVFLLSGEPGIGKTRLAGELATEARQRGARVLVGRAYEAEGAPPLWPWAEIVRGYLADADAEAARADLAPAAADLARVIPELREVFPDLLPSPDLGAEHARFGLFSNVRRLLAALARRQPLVIVLDDL